MKTPETLKTSVLFALALSLAPAGSFAASSVSDSLTGYTGTSQDDFPSQPAFLASSDLNASFVWAGGANAFERVDFDTAGASFGGNLPTNRNDGVGRNYLRTNDTDYHTVGFTAYVTVERTSRESVFFGLGAGDLGDGKVPDVGTGNASVFLELQENFDNASRRVIGGTPGSPTNAEDGFNSMTFATGTMRLRMIYDPVAATVEFAIDYSPDGDFVADQAFDPVDVSGLSAEWTGGDPASVYFGTQGYLDGTGARVGTTMTDFRVQLASDPRSPDGAQSIIDSLKSYSGDTQVSFPGQPAFLTTAEVHASFVFANSAAAFETITFDASGATFGTGTPNATNDRAGRNYLRTNERDFHTVGFTAYVTVDRTERESVFFGMGTGDLGTGKAPDIGTGNAAVFLELQDNFDNASRRVLAGTPEAPTNVQDGFDAMTTVVGPMRLRMVFDPTAETVEFAIDYTPAAEFVAEQTFDAVDVSSISPEWAAGEPARVFFGAQGYLDGLNERAGITMSDFQVDVVAPSQNLVITAITKTGTTATISVNGAPNTTITCQSSLNLQGFSPIATNPAAIVTDANGDATFEVDATETTKFYLVEQ